MESSNVNILILDKLYFLSFFFLICLARKFIHFIALFEEPVLGFTDFFLLFSCFFVLLISILLFIILFYLL